MFLKLFLLIIFGATSARFRTYKDNEVPPLYEFGAGAVWSQIPDYPGARYSKKLFIPFPVGIYRGKRLRADQEGGMRGRFFYAKNYEVNLSIGGSLPGKSKDNPDRAGMPGLDTVLEFGPGLILHFYRITQHNPVKFSLNLPVRTAFSFDSDSLVHRGFVFNPVLYLIYDRLFFKQVSLFASIDTRLATQKNQDIYYSVGPLQATSLRPQYEAKGGYMGSGMSLGFNYNYKNRFTVFTGGYYSNYQGAANEKSYLLQQSHTLSMAIGIVWWFYHSKEKGLVQ